MMGRPSPRKDQHTQKLSRFPGSRLGLLSAPSRSPSSGTVACADFIAAHSCGAAMDSSSLPLHETGGMNHHFPLGSLFRGPLSLAYSILRDDPPQVNHTLDQVPCQIMRICIYSNPKRKSRDFMGVAPPLSSRNLREPWCQNTEGTPGWDALVLAWDVAGRRTTSPSSAPSSLPSSRPSSWTSWW